MKKLLYTTLVLFAAISVARAQDTAISVSDVKAEIAGENLQINFTVTAAGLQINCNGHLKAEFAIEDADNRLVLPVVVYSGAQRYRYDRRNKTLSGAYHIEPYHIYKKVRKDKTYSLDYRLTIPYYPWMADAALTCREYLHDCAGDYENRRETLVADMGLTPVIVEPEVWGPRAELFPNLVSFLVPEVEQVKARASMIELPIGFPVNVTEVRPDFGDNRRELARADSLVGMLHSNELIQINAVNIKGYASPEGKYSVNERLARGRSESFKQYLVKNYPDNQYVRNAHTTWEPEDWEGFGRMVEASDIPAKQDVLSIVYDKSIAPDTKDGMLQKIVWWSQNYGVILREMFPKLRRIELRVDYTIKNIDRSDVNKARELLYTNPDMLSMDEIYRVAQLYKPDSPEYREVYEIAARQYPNDVIANNNAAAALLQEGNADAALPYLEKIAGRDESLINYGAYWYVKGDLNKATEYFNRAKAAGIEQAEQNIRLANPAQK